MLGVLTVKVLVSNDRQVVDKLVRDELVHVHALFRKQIDVLGLHFYLSFLVIVSKFKKKIFY